jgi:hypothetical protein
VRQRRKAAAKSFLQLQKVVHLSIQQESDLRLLPYSRPSLGPHNFLCKLYIYTLPFVNNYGKRKWLTTPTK